MDRKDIAEEHRKYLDLKDNPARVSTSAIFKLVSDGQLKLSGRMSVLETKQDQCCEKITVLDNRVEKVTDDLDARVSRYKSEFDIQTVASAGNTAKFEERFTWQDKMQKIIVGFLIFILSLLFLILGIPVSFP